MKVTKETTVSIIIYCLLSSVIYCLYYQHFAFPETKYKFYIKTRGTTVYKLGTTLLALIMTLGMTLASRSCTESVYSRSKNNLPCFTCVPNRVWWKSVFTQGHFSQIPGMTFDLGMTLTSRSCNERPTYRHVYTTFGEIRIKGIGNKV